MGFITNLFFNTTAKFCSNSKSSASVIMKYLNVAEKNDAAKNIAAILSRGASNRREGFSKYNKIYEFDATVLGQPAQMAMTSVSGHLLTFAFVSTFKNWRGCNPSALFDAAVVKQCPEEFQNIKKTLEREIRSCNGLIIWTDCDREGENIGFEVIKVCTDIKPNLQVYRAKFSEITGASIFRALGRLEQPNRNVSDAVDVRSELDLRTGAAFTRLQTLRLQKVFPEILSDKLISYGSCQFPTLGFVVERYKAIENFVKEAFWRIKMNHTVKELTTDFTWERERLFDKNACQAFLDICQENPQATVESVESKAKSKWRPLPLDTVEMEKNISRKLKINAKETMKIAEKLYTQGFISYPRTETNIFAKELNLANLVEMQREDANWGTFASRIMNEGGPTPRQGKKSDQAHPPIHPTKHAPNLQGNEKRVYEYIVRHFLACVHKDAQGFETVVKADIAEEKFQAKGLIILEKNYLDVYTYEKWNGKEISNYEEGDQFEPTVLEMVEGSTSAPNLLTEADLIALMEKHGIGTDATHADHIDTIKSREYVGLHDNIYFLPGNLGMGLVEGYNSIGLEISLAKPNLRAEFEADLKLICDGLKDADVVRREQIAKYRAVFETVAGRMRLIDDSLATRLNQQAQEFQADLNVNPNDFRPAFKCPKCGNDMIVRKKKDGSGFFLSCVGYPACKNAIWFPANVTNAEVTDEACPQCGGSTKKVKFTFRQNIFPGSPNPDTYCICCNANLREAMDISLSAVRRVANNQTNANATVVPQRPPAPAAPNQRNLNNWLNRTDNNTGNATINQPRPPPANNRTNNWLSSNGIMTNPPVGPPPSPRPRPSTSNTENDAGTATVCACNNPALELTVRKEGPNTGRKFFKCANSICDFFLWSTEGNNGNTTTTNVAAPRNDNNQDGGGAKCKCLLPVVTRTVSKAGPNTGRQFYACPKPIGQGCGFFQWCDEDDGGAGGSGGGNDWGGGGGGGGGAGGGGGTGWIRKGNKAKGSKAKTATGTAPYNNQTRAKRKCSRCAQEGHTRNKCPNM